MNNAGPSGLAPPTAQPGGDARPPARLPPLVLAEGQVGFGHAGPRADVAGAADEGVQGKDAACGGAGSGMCVCAERAVITAGMGCGPHVCGGGSGSGGSGGGGGGASVAHAPLR